MSKDAKLDRILKEFARSVERIKREYPVPNEK
jgi:hypothetical protein